MIPALKKHSFLNIKFLQIWKFFVNYTVASGGIPASIFFFWGGEGEGKRNFFWGGKIEQMCTKLAKI